MFRTVRRRRRQRVRGGAFPEAWRRILSTNVPLYRRMGKADRRELEAHVLVFLDEKRFEGAAGLAVTDEIRVTIAGHACTLLMHRTTDYYPGLHSIIVYPDTYVVPQARRSEDGTVFEGQEARLGESWIRGAVVLSWRGVQGGDDSACENVAIHEFAHQLDAQDGDVEGIPVIADPTMIRAWAEILGREYQALRSALARGRPTLLRAYGAKNPAEFFAVATECYFQQPEAMESRHPDLYRELRSFYRIDPARLGEP